MDEETREKASLSWDMNSSMPCEWALSPRTMPDDVWMWFWCQSEWNCLRFDWTESHSSSQEADETGQSCSHDVMPYALRCSECPSVPKG